MARAYICLKYLSFHMIYHVGFALLHIAHGVVYVVQEGKNITLICDSSVVEYPQWIGPTLVFNEYGNSRIREYVGEKSDRLSWDPVDNRSLIVHHLTKKDSGVFSCFNEYNVIRKHVVYVIDFTLDVFVKEGDNMTLSCDSSAVEYPKWRGPPNSAWYNSLRVSKIEYAIGEKSNRLSWDQVNNKSLVVHNVIRNDSGVYLCADQYNTAIEGHVVYVIDVAASVTYVVQEGGNVTMPCDSSKNAYPGWTGPSKHHLSYSEELTFRGEASNRLSWDLVNNKSLIIHSVTKKDSGAYLCFDKYSNVEKHDVYVIVKPEKPEISNKEILDDGSEVVRGTIDTLLKLTCTSSGGFPKSNLEWFRDNKQTHVFGSNETYKLDVDGNYIVELTYTFTPTRNNDGDLYLCQSFFEYPQHFNQTDEVKLLLNLKPEESSTFVLLYGIVGVLVAIISTILVVFAVRKRRHAEFTRRNTTVHRDTTKSPGTANPTSGTEMKLKHGEHNNIELSVYEEFEELKGNAAGGKMSNDLGMKQEHGQNYSQESSVNEELEELKENAACGKISTDLEMEQYYGQNYSIESD